MTHWLSHAFYTYVLHVQRANGYQWWSGFGANFGEISVVLLAIGAWRHINCASPWCPRLGKHPTADGLHKLCRKHHPDLPDKKLTLAEIQDRHEKAKPASQRGRQRKLNDARPRGERSEG